MERNLSELKYMTVAFSVVDGHEIDGIVVPRLCHGDSIVDVVYSSDDVGVCDALVTKNKDVALGVKTADCAPICFADHKLFGIAHVGWRGLCLGLIEKMHLKFDEDSLEVFVGPHMHSFTIQKDFCYDLLIEKFGGAFIETTGNDMVFHFKDAIASLLPSGAIFDARNTYTDLSLPSHRRDKTSKRLLTVVQCKNEPSVG